MATKGAGAAALLATLITGGTATAFANASAHLGVGDSATAESAAHTDLQAATNKVRKAMMAGYPTVNGAAMTFKSEFGDADAVFEWKEVGLFNASSAGTMLVRNVPSPSLGVKPNDETWYLTATVTVQ